MQGILQWLYPGPETKLSLIKPLFYYIIHICGTSTIITLLKEFSYELNFIIFIKINYIHGNHKVAFL